VKPAMTLPLLAKTTDKGKTAHNLKQQWQTNKINESLGEVIFPNGKENKEVRN